MLMALKTTNTLPSYCRVLGAKTYGLLKSLTAPAKPSEKSYKEIVDILKNHLNPKPLVIGERFRFWKRDQKVW